MTPEITHIDLRTYEYPVEDIQNDPRYGFVYEPGAVSYYEDLAVQIHTDTGITGEYIGGNSMAMAQSERFAEYLIGEDPLRRERHWNEMQRVLRNTDRMGVGPLDIALWDFAGKYYDAPIHELLGTHRKHLPAYASTLDGDRNGGLDSPAAFADFAEECLEDGFPAFKIHPWGGDWYDVDRMIETIAAVGERVGDEMDLMLDPFCNPPTFAEAMKIGWACDEHDYLWLEDPYHDGGQSFEGHRRLRDRIDTPLLQSELTRGVESHADALAHDATDYLRADPADDGGITGSIKIARVAEGFGVDVEYHGCGPAQRHCMAATRNSNYYELVHVHPAFGIREPPVYDGGYTDSIEAADDGSYAVPDDPGLGVEYDWSYVDANEKLVRSIE